MTKNFKTTQNGLNYTFILNNDTLMTQAEMVSSNKTWTSQTHSNMARIQFNAVHHYVNNCRLINNTKINVAFPKTTQPNGNICVQIIICTPDRKQYWFYILLNPTITSQHTVPTNNLRSDYIADYNNDFDQYFFPTIPESDLYYTYNKNLVPVFDQSNEYDYW